MLCSTAATFLIPSGIPPHQTLLLFKDLPHPIRQKPLNRLFSYCSSFAASPFQTMHQASLCLPLKTAHCVVSPCTRRQQSSATHRKQLSACCKSLTDTLAHQLPQLTNVKQLTGTCPPASEYLLPPQPGNLISLHMFHLENRL